MTTGELFHECATQVHKRRQGAPIYKASGRVPHKHVKARIHRAKKTGYAASFGHNFNPRETAQELMQTSG
jgi:hypothetical protein